MGKIIHYFWFGGKPLPRSVKKCIKSWQRYLPDWEIHRWDENNFDVRANAFTQQAYEQKKWAFVADYARMSVLYDQGGLYLDTDMEIVRKIDDLLEKPMFLGREYEVDLKEMIAGGVIYVKSRHNKYIKKMLDFYESKAGFDSNVMYSYSVPKIITKVLERYSVSVRSGGEEIFDGNVWVYPKEYFYPISYDGFRKFFSDKTAMVHHYDASWAGKGDKRERRLRNVLPVPIANIVLGGLGTGAHVKSFGKRVLHAANVRVRTHASVLLKRRVRVAKLREDIGKEKNDYLVFSQPKWLGVSKSAQENFGGFVPLMETNLYTKWEVQKIAESVVGSGRSLVIFNGLAFGWDGVIREIKRLNPKIVVKIIHHGGEVRLARQLDYESFMKILGLHDVGLVDEIGFVKKQQADFYAMKGYRAKFLMNTARVTDAKKYMVGRGVKSKNVKVGLYCSGDLEWKNVFNQIAAASLIEDVELDCVPFNPQMVNYAGKLGVSITGETDVVANGKLFMRMAANDINLYASFAEASPILPLESMELGVPCITSNNHHYWMGTELQKYLIVDRPDDVIAIYHQIEKVLKNRSKIMKLYKEWKIKYDKRASETIRSFLESDSSGGKRHDK